MFCKFYAVELLRNVKENRLRDIYRESPILKDLRSPDKYEGKCGICEYNKVCGGSRARAYGATGNYMASEPFCVYTPEKMRKK